MENELKCEPVVTQECRSVPDQVCVNVVQEECSLVQTQEEHEVCGEPGEECFDDVQTKCRVSQKNTRKITFLHKRLSK